MPRANDDDRVVLRDGRDGRGGGGGEQQPGHVTPRTGAAGLFGRPGPVVGQHAAGQHHGRTALGAAARLAARSSAGGHHRVRVHGRATLEKQNEAITGGLHSTYLFILHPAIYVTPR